MFVLVADSHGQVPPGLEPIHRLAWVASGFFIWQNSTENTKFHLAQVKHVKQVVSSQRGQNPRLKSPSHALPARAGTVSTQPRVLQTHPKPGLGSPCNYSSSCGKENKLNQQNSVDPPSFCCVLLEKIDSEL